MQYKAMPYPMDFPACNTLTTDVSMQSKVAAVDAGATAFAHRDSLVLVQYGSEWSSDAGSAKNLELISALQRTMEGYLDKTVPAYINYLDVQMPSQLG